MCHYNYHYDYWNNNYCWSNYHDDHDYYDYRNDNYCWSDYHDHNNHYHDARAVRALVADYEHISGDE